MIQCVLWAGAVQSFRSVEVRPCLSSASTSELPASLLLLLLLLHNSHPLVLNKPAGTPRSIETHKGHIAFLTCRLALFYMPDVLCDADRESKCSSFLKGRLAFRSHEPFVHSNWSEERRATLSCVWVAIDALLGTLRHTGQCEMSFTHTQEKSRHSVWLQNRLQCYDIRISISDGTYYW